MNASEFMDKQIMELARSKSDSSNTNNDFIDLVKSKLEEDSNGGLSSVKKKEEILAGYDFQPIPRSSAAFGVHSLSSSAPFPAANAISQGVAARAWNSLDAKPNSSPSRSSSPVDLVEPDKVVLEKAQKVNDSAILSEIDRTMKKYADSLLHAVDSLGERLSQLESRTSKLEYFVDDLKVYIGNNHGSIDGRMRQLENILLELQTGVQDVKDKQEVMEGYMQLAKLQISEVEKSSEAPNSAHQKPLQQSAASAPQQPSRQQFPIGVTQPVPTLPLNAPLLASQQNIHPAALGTAQFHPGQIPSRPQRDVYLPTSGQTQEVPSQQYQIPSAQYQQQSPLPAPRPPQQCQPAPTPHYAQPSQPLQPQHPSVVAPNVHHQQEESPYIPPQTYPPNLHPAISPPSSGAPHFQTYYGSPPIYELAPSSRPSSGFSSSYVPPSGPEPYTYGGAPSHYGSTPSIKPRPHSPRGSSNYPQIPTAKILPQAVPTAAAVSGGSNSGGTGNRVPVEDVIDKVTSMGFPREHVRATVRKLTENGQSVDLNVVLDKLMNDEDVQPQMSWFRR